MKIKRVPFSNEGEEIIITIMFEYKLKKHMKRNGKTEVHTTSAGEMG